MDESQHTPAVPWTPHDKWDRIIAAYYAKLNAYAPFSEALTSLLTGLAALLENEPQAREILNAPPAAGKANRLRIMEDLSRDPETPPDIAADYARQIEQIRLAEQVQSALQE